MEDISNLEWTILWRQDWYVIRVYESKKRRGESGYVNAEKFRKLKAQGDQAVADNDIDELKRVLFRLSEIQVRTAKDHTDENDLFDKANILRG